MTPLERGINIMLREINPGADGVVNQRAFQVIVTLQFRKPGLRPFSGDYRHCTDKLAQHKTGKPRQGDVPLAFRLSFGPNMSGVRQRCPAQLRRNQRGKIADNLAVLRVTQFIRQFNSQLIHQR